MPGPGEQHPRHDQRDRIDDDRGNFVSVVKVTPVERGQEDERPDGQDGAMTPDNACRPQGTGAFAASALAAKKRARPIVKYPASSRAMKPCGDRVRCLRKVLPLRCQGERGSQK